MGWLSRLLGGGGEAKPPDRPTSRRRRPEEPEPPEGSLGPDELARRLDVPPADLLAVKPSYQTFEQPKRSGGVRRIAAPEASLKALQRRLLSRVLDRLEVHPAATGFEHGRSIVTNALPHAGKAVVLKMDLVDFFESTTDKRVARYFRAVGWNSEARRILLGLCTWKGGLPQGAPTSPRLSNLVNRQLDLRLAGLAKKFGAAYTRYADDLTFSFDRDEPAATHSLIGLTKIIVGEYGYRLHQKRKLQIRRRHEQQRVTGLVVNQSVNLPRKTRRLLRSAAHRMATGRNPTFTPEQLAGWRALRSMIATQSGEPKA